MSRDTAGHFDRNNDYTSSGPSSKKVKKKFKKQKEKFEEKFNKQEDKFREMVHGNPSAEQSTANKLARMKKERQEAEEEGYKRGEEFLNRPVQGFSPEERATLQYERERDVDREQKAANRKLLGEQGMRGIVGRGGIGEAQRRELANAGQAARAGVTRDLDKLSSERALKRQAQIFSMGQGASTQAQTDRQMLENQRNYEKEQRDAERREKKLFKTLKKI